MKSILHHYFDDNSRFRGRYSEHFFYWLKKLRLLTFMYQSTYMSVFLSSVGSMEHPVWIKNKGRNNHQFLSAVLRIRFFSHPDPDPIRIRFRIWILNPQKDPAESSLERSVSLEYKGSDLKQSNSKSGKDFKKAYLGTIRTRSYPVLLGHRDQDQIRIR